MKLGYRGWIWVDAICINQDDLVERGRQVAIMKDIFSLAQEVVTYLGGDHEHDLRDHPYWTRAWIIQEIVFAKQLTIVNASAKIKIQWEEFVQQQQRMDSRDESWTTHYICRLDVQRLSPKNFLLTALELTRDAHCSDPRDALYAKLGLSSDGPTIVPLPDYTLSVEDVFKDFIKTWVTETGDLTIIFYAGESPRSLPSWTPDWSVETAKFPVTMHATSGPDFDSSYGGGKIDVSWSESLNLMHVRGLNLDTVVFPEGAIATTPYFCVQTSRSDAASGFASLYDGMLDCECPQNPDIGFSPGTGGEVTRTESDRCAHVPMGAMNGDEICLLYGCPRPVVLRKQNDGRYILIGECYIGEFQTYGELGSSSLQELVASKVKSSEEVIFSLK